MPVDVNSQCCWMCDTPIQTHFLALNPLTRISIEKAAPFLERLRGADDETRTRDPHLGKVMRYQLRYIRMTNRSLLQSLKRALVRDTGIEPVTSSVSGKRSPTELIALNARRHYEVEVETGIEPVCTVLQTVASPLGHSTVAIPPHTIQCWSG